MTSCEANVDPMLFSTQAYCAWLGLLRPRDPPHQLLLTQLGSTSYTAMFLGIKILHSQSYKVNQARLICTMLSLPCHHHPCAELIGSRQPVDGALTVRELPE